MGKMSELSLVLDEVADTGKALIETADVLASCGEKLLSETRSIKEAFGDEPPAREQDAAKVEKAQESNSPADVSPDNKGKDAAPDDAEPAPQEKNYSYEYVRGVLADLSASGHRDAARSLILKHGANKLSDIAPSEYAAIIAEAEVEAHAG